MTSAAGPSARGVSYDGSDAFVGVGFGSGNQAIEYKYESDSDGYDPDDNGAEPETPPDRDIYERPTRGPSTYLK